MLIAGAMSGTSADGVDVAVARVTFDNAAGAVARPETMTATLVVHRHRPYDADLRQRIFRLRESGTFEWRELATVGRALTLAYAKAVHDACATASVDPSQLDAI